RPLSAQVDLPADPNRADTAVPARGLCRRLGPDRRDDAVHGVRVRRHPVHRCDDRPLCRRSPAQPGHRHAACGRLRRQLAGEGGGNTIIGMELVAKSRPDGHTLLLGTTTLATNAALGLKQPYDPLKDFQPISTIVDIPDFIALNKDHPAKDYKAFADWVNKQSD